MIRTTKDFWRVLFGFLFLTGLFAGCAPAEKELLVGEAKLRIINASPEANEYSFFINDTLKTGQPLKFGEGSPYLSVSAGTNEVYTKANDVVIPNTKSAFFLNRNQNHSLFLAGILAKDSLIYVSTLDENVILSDTMATVRFINLSPDAANLNLVFQKNLVDSTSVISSINYRTASRYVKVKPTNYFFRVKTTAGSVKLANLDNYMLEAGKIYTIWTKGLVKGDGDYALEIKVLLDN